MAGFYEWVQFDADPNKNLDLAEFDIDFGLIEVKGTVEEVCAVRSAILVWVCIVCMYTIFK